MTPSGFLGSKENKSNLDVPIPSAAANELMLNTTPGFPATSDQGASQIALRKLFDQEESTVLRYAFSLVGRREVAEEIVQDVFLQLHKSWDDVESPRAWLFTAIRNRAFHYLRRRREMLLGEQADPSTGDHEAPPVTLERLEMLSALRVSMDELSETDQQLLRLKYFENLKYREIGQRLGMSVSNVGYRLHHILKQLGGKLRQLGLDENE